MKKNYKIIILVICILIMSIFYSSIANADEEIEPEWFPTLLVKGTSYADEIYSIMGSNMYFNLFVERNGYDTGYIMGSYISLPLKSYKENEMIKKNELRKTIEDGITKWEENVTFTFYSKLHVTSYGFVVSRSFNRNVKYSCYLGNDNIIYYSLKITDDSGYVEYEVENKRIDELPSSVAISDIGFTTNDYQYGQISIQRQIDSTLGITDLTSTWILHKKGSSENIAFYKSTYNYQYARLFKLNKSSGKSTNLVSNSQGRIELNDIPFGTYVLEEISSNVQNCKKVSIEFTIGSYGFSYDQNGNIVNSNRNLTIEIQDSSSNNPPDNGENGGSGTDIGGNNNGGSGGNSGGGNDVNTGGSGNGSNTGGSGGNTGKPGNNTGSSPNGTGGSSNGTSSGNNSTNSGVNIDNGSSINADSSEIDEDGNDLVVDNIDDLEGDNENIVIDYSNNGTILEKILSLFKGNNIVYYILPISLILIIIVVALLLPKRKK